MADLQKTMRERAMTQRPRAGQKGITAERVTQAALGRQTTLPACLSLAKHMVLVPRTTVAATRKGYLTHTHTHSSAPRRLSAAAAAVFCRVRFKVQSSNGGRRPLAFVCLFFFFYMWQMFGRDKEASAALRDSDRVIMVHMDSE